MNQKSEPVLKPFDAGIDLGTTLSGIARLRTSIELGRYEGEANFLLPTAVMIPKQEKGETKIGTKVLDGHQLNPDGFAWRWKPLTGLAYDEKKAKDMLATKKYSEMEVKKAEDARGIVFILNNRPYYAMDLSRIFLQKFKKDMEGKWGPLDSVVISVPAYFNLAQKTCTDKAAQEAGFKRVELVEEPVAAAIYQFWEMKRHEVSDATILVYDFGGGTFDASIVFGQWIRNKEGELIPRFTVLRNKGDMILGGDDIDQELYNRCFENIERAYGKQIAQQLDMSQEGMCKQLRFVIRRACEVCKQELSDSETSVIDIDQDIRLEMGTKKIKINLRVNREDFNSMINPYVEKTHDIITGLLEESPMDESQIQYVFPVGGSTIIPLVRERLTDRFGEKVIFPEKPQECVLRGAALFAAHPEWLEGAPTTHHTGIEVARGVLEPIIEAGTLMIGGKAVNKRTFYTIVDNADEIATWVWQWEANADPTPGKHNSKVAYFYMPIPLGLPKGTEVNIEIGVDREGKLAYGRSWIGQEEKSTECITPIPQKTEETLLSEKLPNWEKQFWKACERWQLNSSETRDLIEGTKKELVVLKKHLAGGKGDVFEKVELFLQQNQDIPNRIENCPFALAALAEQRGKISVLQNPQLRFDVDQLQRAMEDVKHQMATNNISPRQITINGEVWKGNLQVIGLSDFPTLTRPLNDMVGLSYKILFGDGGGGAVWEYVMGSLARIIEDSCDRLKDDMRKPPEFEQEEQNVATTCQNQDPDAIKVLHEFVQKWINWVCEAWITNGVICKNPGIRANLKTTYAMNIENRCPSSDREMLTFVTGAVGRFCDEAWGKYCDIKPKPETRK
jgi:molecular chaperone DnaK (HSP70)